MKTEQEIKDKIKQLEYDFCKSIDNDMNEIISGKINAWNWVLEEPEYKRTIYDLTADELLQLVKIITRQNNYSIYTIKYIRRNIDDKRVVFTLVNEYNDALETWADEIMFILGEDLTITARCGIINVKLINTVKYVDAIRNMLSMEKSDAII